MKATYPAFVRIGLVIAMALGCLVTDGVARDFTPAAWLEGRLVDAAAASQTGGRVDIVIEHWSTDDENERLRMALSDEGSDALLSALEKTIKVRAGVLQFPGHHGLGARARVRRAQNLMFARERHTPAGRQVIVVTPVRLGLGQPNRSRRPTEAEFSLIDIRFGADGKGVAKRAVSERIAYNQHTKMLELAGYETEPALLIDVAEKR